MKQFSFSGNVQEVCIIKILQRVRDKKKDYIQCQLQFVCKKLEGLGATICDKIMLTVIIKCCSDIGVTLKFTQ